MGDLQSSSSITIIRSSPLMLGTLIVSWITVLWLPGFFVLASFDNSFIPAIKASYSAWLLLALKAKRNDCSIITPSGPSNTIPAPLPRTLEAPSTDRVQGEA
ncbi:hypothetical protein L195_g057277, partial [Trifolium pratense]